MQSHQFFTPETRQCKGIFVTPELLLSAFVSPQVIDGMIECCDFAGLPDGCRVATVFYDQFERRFAFVLWHEFWPEVPLGDQLPILDLQVTRNQYRVAGVGNRGREFL